MSLIVPLRIIFRRVLLAEIPPRRAVGGLGRRAIARLVAAVAIADADIDRVLRRAIAPPAREAPIRRAASTAHACESGETEQMSLVDGITRSI